MSSDPSGTPHSVAPRASRSVAEATPGRGPRLAPLIACALVFGLLGTAATVFGLLELAMAHSYPVSRPTALSVGASACLAAVVFAGWAARVAAQRQHPWIAVLAVLVVLGAGGVGVFALLL